MAESLLTPLYGISNTRLQEATAIESHVLQGDTFYAGDKTLRTGTLIPPTGNYSCTCNYSAPNRCTYLTFTFKDSGNYTVKVTYSTGWICYLVVNNNGNRVLQTVNTGTNGNPSWTFDAYNGYTFALELHTDNEGSSNRFVNTQTEVIRNH